MAQSLPSGRPFFKELYSKSLHLSLTSFPTPPTLLLESIAVENVGTIGLMGVVGSLVLLGLWGSPLIETLRGSPLEVSFALLLDPFDVYTAGGGDKGFDCRLSFGELPATIKEAIALTGVD